MYVYIYIHTRYITFFTACHSHPGRNHPTSSSAMGVNSTKECAGGEINRQSCCIAHDVLSIGRPELEMEIIGFFFLTKEVI